MRIALVTTSFLPRVGGAEYVVHNLATTWQRQGHEVCVFNSFSSPTQHRGLEYRVEKYRVPLTYFRLPPHRLPFSLYCARNIGNALRGFRPDVISAHFGYPLAVWLAKIVPAPDYLITCHGRELTKFSWGHRSRYGIDRVLAEALNRSAGAVAISQFARKSMEEMGVQPEKILDIPNGVDLERFRTKVDEDFRGRFGIPQDAVLVLSVGREHPQKAFDLGIKAFGRVVANNPRARYAIVGQGTSKWQGLVESLGLKEKVFLCERLGGADLVAAYQQADIYFSPSVWEMMPLVVLEAMAAGLPLVVTDVSGSQDLVIPSENGFIAEPRNIEEMAASLGQLVQDDSMRTQMASSSGNRAEEYGWDNICRKYLKGYEAVKKPG